MKVVMLVENSELEGPKIKQWIETGIAGVQVLWITRTQDAEVRLEKFNKTPGVLGCIVLDMFFRDFTGRSEPLGRHILDACPDTPIVVISKRDAAREYVQTRDDVPLLQLDKPRNWSSADNPELKLKLQEFRRDLVEAVKCALLVGSLRADVKRLSEKRSLRPFFTTRVAKAAIPFLLCVLFYALSIIYLPGLVQHVLLALCAVMGVHLLDRAVLVKDIRDAYESVRTEVAELSVVVQHSAQESKDKLIVVDDHRNAPEDMVKTKKAGGDETST
jgi:hypothetical protein